MESLFNIILFAVPQGSSFRIISNGLMVITTVQIPLTKFELSFCSGKNPTCGVSEIHNRENFRPWSLLKRRIKKKKNLSDQ